jgi:hypothetical protein
MLKASKLTKAKLEHPYGLISSTDEADSAPLPTVLPRTSTTAVDQHESAPVAREYRTVISSRGIIQNPTGTKDNQFEKEEKKEKERKDRKRRFLIYLSLTLPLSLVPLR